LELLVNEVRPDVLHLSQYCYGDLRIDVPRIVVAHSDVVSWWAGVHHTEPEDTPLMRNYRRRVTNGLRAADLVVAPSQSMLDAVSRYYFKPENGTVIHNGRTPALFETTVAKEDFVLCVGRIWDAGKNVQLLFKRELPLPIRVVGWEHEPGRETRPLPADIPPNVQLLGAKSQEELRSLFARAGVYIATSRYEPFGLSPLEGAFSGCALVMNDIPVFHELWGDAALYFTHSDDLARVLGEVRQDSAMRDEYGARALERARRRFTAEAMVEQYENAYEGACAPAEAA
jgi:glycosyltransferase involved in cell wall biosynthesis